MTGCYQLQMLFSGTVKGGRGTTLHSDLASDHGRRNDDHDAIHPAPRGGSSPPASDLGTWRLACQASSHRLASSSVVVHRCTAKIRPPGPGRTRHVAAGLFLYQFISAGCQIQAGAVDDTMNVHHPVSHPTCIPEQEG